MKKIEQLKRIQKSHLCNRCGSCIGLSGGKIVFNRKEASYRPKILKELTEEETEIILHACSGKNFSFPKYQSFVFPKQTNHKYIGTHQNIFIAHSTDEEIRKKAASGGILSQILIYLLESSQIDGAVVTRMSIDKPWEAEAFIAKTRKEILEAAQSKYIITSVNEILPQIKKFEGRLAYVGLPGQVQSIRKLQEINHPSVKNIQYIFGPFYGNTLHTSSIVSFLKSNGEKNIRKVKKLYFRYGEWPGNLRVELTDGKTFELKKFHANYLIPFHILKNSLLCTDFTNEFTDISGGDAWAPKYEERGKGFSMVISRSEQGKKILDEMIKLGKIELTPISADEAIEMHSHGYDLKKRGSFIRIKLRRLVGLPIPDYGYMIENFAFKRYLMEIVITSLFIVLGTRLARWFVELIPPKTIGKLFEWARTSWKRQTHSIKRTQL